MIARVSRGETIATAAVVCGLDESAYRALQAAAEEGDPEARATLDGLTTAKSRAKAREEAALRRSVAGGGKTGADALAELVARGRLDWQLAPSASALAEADPLGALTQAELDAATPEQRAALLAASEAQAAAEAVARELLGLGG